MDWNLGRTQSLSQDGRQKGVEYKETGRDRRERKRKQEERLQTINWAVSYWENKIDIQI